MLKRGDKGDEVRKLQQDLVELGYDLPRGGVDGDLGCETLVAVARFLCDHGTDDANVVSDAELALVQKVLAETRGRPADPQPAGVMKRGDKGDDVRKLQQDLIELGYDLPRWGADGDLGTEALDALARFLRDHGMATDDDADVVSDAELALVQKVLAETRDAPVGPPLASGKFHDLRATAAQSNIGGRRPWTQITGITLHQTACVLGENPPRWNTIAAHLGVTRGGQVVWMHDFEKIVWHGNGFNNTTIGIEMDGTYAGVDGDDRTFWRPTDEPTRTAQTPTPELIEAAKATVRWICQEVVRHGGRIKQIVAHRQSSNQRDSDPGSALWQRVAMPLHQELGLDDGGPGYTVGNGYPIPEKWDPSRVGVKY
jgi:N-acetyl-anhydromuramyl-L-alanine amidase AmpD